MIKIIIMLLNFSSVFTVALSNLLAQIPMADTFRSEGKIFVVLAVVLIILAGLFIVLFRQDKKIKKLEDKFNKEKEQ